MYEGILVDVAFAGFFLAKWLGRQSFLDDLASLDPDLYNGLVFLKHYDGDVGDLALNFTVASDGVLHFYLCAQAKFNHFFRVRCDENCGPHPERIEHCRHEREPAAVHCTRLPLSTQQADQITKRSVL